MTISLVGTSSANAVSSLTPALVLPTGIAFGDAVGVVAIGSTTTTITAPAGWTLRSGFPADGGNARMYAWTKDAVTLSDSGSSHTFTISPASTKAIFHCFVLHSGNGFPADWTDDLTFTAHTATSASYTAPASLSTVAGTWGVAAFGTRGTGPFSDWTPASGLVERQDFTHTGGGATTLQFCDSDGSVGGASTTWGPFTESNTSTANGGALTWLVKENASSGTGGGANSYPKVGFYRNHPGDGGWRTRMDACEATYGAFQGHWSYYFAVGTAPLNAEVTQAIQDGKRLHIYWKAYDVDWADTAAGNYDTEIDGFAADIVALAPAPGQVWLTIHHEPEDDYIAHGSGGAGWTAANYRGMWQRIRARFDAGGASQYVTWVMAYQNSHSHPAEMITLWGNDSVMDGLIDVMAQQSYIRRTDPPGEIATKWLEDLEWARTNQDTGRHWGYLSKPQGFTEWGSALGGLPADRDTDTHRAQTLDAVRGILPDLAARSVAEIDYFDAGESNYIVDPPSVDGVAYQQLKAASEAGQQAGPVTIVGSALARDGATGTATTIPFVLPTGWQQGDYALAYLVANSLPAVTVVPTGWVLQDGPTDTGAIGRAWIYAKTLQAGEADPTWTIDTAVRPSGVLVVLRGVDAANPVHAMAALQSSAAATSHAAPAVTTNANQAFILTAWLARWSDASGNGGVNYGTPPGTHTTTGTVSVNSGANAGSGGLVATLTAGQVGPGSHGSYTATFPVLCSGLVGQLAILPAGAEITPQLTETATGTDTLSVATGATEKTLTDSGAAADTPSVSSTGPGSLTDTGAAADALSVATSAPTVGFPTQKIEVAFATQPMATSPVWTDITTYVLWPLQRVYGRPDEFSQVQPGTLRLRLRNSDGRFTMGKTTGPYGTGVRVGRRLRWTETFNGVAYTRFDGHVDGWPTQWVADATRDAIADITATDRLKRFGQVGELRSLLEEEILRDAAVCYFPLSEPDGATSATSIASTPQAATAIRQAFDSSGGTIEFAAGTGPGTDGLAAAVFTPVSQVNGKYLFGPLGGVWSSSQTSLEAWFNTSTTPTPAAMPICSVTTHVDEALTLAVSTAGKVQWGFTGGGAQVAGNASPSSYNDGRTHQAIIALSRSGSTVTARLYVDGAQVNATTFAYVELPSWGRVDIGGSHDGSFAGVYTGTLSHVAAYPTALLAAQVAVHYHAGADGLTGERTDQRIGRAADYIAIPTADRAFDQGDSLIGGQATSGKQPLEVMREAEAVEQGVLFVASDGRLTFHKRSRRYNQAPVLTLDGAAGRIQVGAVFPGDDFGLLNDYTVTRPGAAGSRAVNQTSVDEYGLYRDSAEVPAVSDDATAALAQWRVGTYGDPRVRVPNLTISLRRLAGQSPAQVATLLGLDISSMLRLTNLPSQAPAVTLDVFVEGWTEQVDRTTGDWSMALNCSPADGATVWQFATTGFSEFATTTRLGL